MSGAGSVPQALTSLELVNMAVSRLVFCSLHFVPFLPSLLCGDKEAASPAVFRAYRRPLSKSQVPAVSQELTMHALDNARQDTTCERTAGINLFSSFRCFQLADPEGL